jgi:hypothetical protein
LNFIPVSKNVKATFPGERRFNQYDHWERINGKFLGPGSYNDHETKLNLKAQPCAVKIVSVISYLILSLCYRCKCNWEKRVAGRVTYYAEIM